MDVNEEDNAESDAKVISLKSVFSSGAITGIFSSVIKFTFSLNNF